MQIKITYETQIVKDGPSLILMQSAALLPYWSVLHSGQIFRRWPDVDLNRISKLGIQIFTVSIKMEIT